MESNSLFHNKNNWDIGTIELRVLLIDCCKLSVEKPTADKVKALHYLINE